MKLEVAGFSRFESREPINTIRPLAWTVSHKTCELHTRKKPVLLTRPPNTPHDKLSK